MLTHQVALVSEIRDVSARELTTTGAALQKQVVRDFEPIWRISATVAAFAKLDDVPLGYWPVIVMKDIKQSGAAGIHEDKDGQPFALVEYDDAWTLTASHETLEMLADPFGNRLIAGPSPKPKQGRVEFLVECCDPCEGSEFAYTVNGVVVSDFYTPHYFDPVAAPGVRYSFGGAITAPRQVLKEGYLSWHHPPTNHWWQEIYFGTKPEFRDLGVLGRLAEGSLRSEIDRLTHSPLSAKRLSESTRRRITTLAARVDASAASDSKAEMWRAQIAQLRAGVENGPG
ncbi:MAG TPA: hypothetical protein VEI06_02790 [Gemmatimonadaceae bacterium]|nr:hypothetical protein [Gemmatimonadaceae bacterium]